MYRIVPIRLTPVSYTTPIFAVRIELVWDTNENQYVWNGAEDTGLFVRIEVKQTSFPSLWKVSGYTGCPGDTDYCVDFTVVTEANNVASASEKFVLKFISEAFEGEPRAVVFTTSVVN